MVTDWIVKENRKSDLEWNLCFRFILKNSDSWWNNSSLKMKKERKKERKRKRKRKKYSKKKEKIKFSIDFLFFRTFSLSHLLLFHNGKYLIHFSTLKNLNCPSIDKLSSSSLREREREREKERRQKWVNQNILHSTIILSS